MPRNLIKIVIFDGSLIARKSSQTPEFFLEFNPFEDFPVASLQNKKLTIQKKLHHMITKEISS